MIDYSFDDDELEGMRQAQNDHMMDHCVVSSFSAGTANEYNESDAPIYTDSAMVICGLAQGSGSEVHGLEMTVIQYDAVLRLPLNISIKETDRIKVVSRFGEFLSDLTYEIVSPIEKGPSGIRILLRKIVT